jgi:hypothetical protein
MGEFFAQGDKERDVGLPISFLCDRNIVKVPSGQVGFINFVIRPWWQRFGELLEEPKQGQLFLKNLEVNFEAMKRDADREKLLETTPSHTPRRTLDPIDDDEPSQDSLGKTVSVETGKIKLFGAGEVSPRADRETDRRGSSSMRKETSPLKGEGDTPSEASSRRTSEVRDRLTKSEMTLLEDAWDDDDGAKTIGSHSPGGYEATDATHSRTVTATLTHSRTHTPRAVKQVSRSIVDATAMEMAQRLAQEMDDTALRRASTIADHVTE